MTGRLRCRALLALLAALIVTLPSSAAAKTALSLGAAAKGERTVVSGQLSGSAAGRASAKQWRVVIERRAGKRWKLLRSMTTKAADGGRTFSATIRVAPTSCTAVRVRVLARGRQLARTTLKPCVAVSEPTDEGVPAVPIGPAPPGAAPPVQPSPAPTAPGTPLNDTVGPATNETPIPLPTATATATPASTATPTPTTEPTPSTTATPAPTATPRPTTTPPTTPTPLPISAPTSISTSFQNSCATVGTDSSCWGDRQFGDPYHDFVPYGPFRPVAKSKNVAALAGGGGRSCVLSTDGSVACTSYTYGDNRSAAAVAGVSGAAQIAAAEDHGCAALKSGGVRCWTTANPRGPLGDGAASPAPDTTVTVAGISDAKGIAAGLGFSCALRSTGSVMCWGAGDRGQIGDGGIGTAPTPQTVKGLSDAASIAAGGATACAIRKTRQVVCWGAGDQGQLGNGGLSDAPVPVAASNLGDAAVLSVGDASSCAVRIDRTAACWGQNKRGQLGDGTTRTSAIPVTVSDLSNATEITTNGDHACARIGGRTGAVRCWGSNGAGELGNGFAGEGTPVPSPPLTAVSDVTTLVMGTSHQCATLSTSNTVCWGANEHGQLGNGTSDPASTAKRVSGIGAVTSLAVGGRHTCALLPDAHVACWGDNQFGQVGVTERGDKLTARVVSGMSDASAITAGTQHTCALRAEGTVWCWGANESGQLGRSPFTVGSASSPLQVPGLTGVQAVASGPDYSCAVTTDAAVFCWGGNEYGQLGNGNREKVTGPRIVPGVADAQTIATGEGLACATRHDTSVVCWGESVRPWWVEPFELTAVDMPGLIGLSPLTGAGLRACGLSSAGAVVCGGTGGGAGEFGDGNANGDLPGFFAGYTAKLAQPATSVTGNRWSTCAVLTDGHVSCWGHNDALWPKFYATPQPVLGFE